MVPQSETTPAGESASSRATDVLFLCLARNCAGTLPNFFVLLRGLRAQGLRIAVLIGENGSTDGTREMIAQAVDLPIQLADTSFMPGVPQRLVRMAAGRQFLLEEARRSGTDAEFVCVADLDNVFSTALPAAGFLGAMQKLREENDLFAVSATSDPYYDVLSLRTRDYTSASLHREIQAAKRRPLTYYRFHQKRIWDAQDAVPRGRWFRCLSSFNGICVYRAAEYWQGSYRAPDEADVCEHVSFNLSIGDATCKDMVISPSLVVPNPADHGRVSFLRFWRDRLRKL